MKALKTILSFLVFLAMLGMVVSVAWQVFTRYILHDPHIWTEEVTRIFLIYMTFPGAALAMLRGDEIRVTVITDHLPVVVQKALRVFMNLCSLVFLAVVFYYVFPLMQRLAHQPLPAIRLSKSYVYGSLVLGSLAMLLVMGERTFHSFAELLGRGKAKEDT